MCILFETFFGFFHCVVDYAMVFLKHLWFVKSPMQTLAKPFDAFCSTATAFCIYNLEHFMTL